MVIEPDPGEPRSVILADVLGRQALPLRGWCASYGRYRVSRSSRRNGGRKTTCPLDGETVDRSVTTRLLGLWQRWSCCPRQSRHRRN